MDPDWKLLKQLSKIGEQVTFLEKIEKLLTSNKLTFIRKIFKFKKGVAFGLIDDKIIGKKISLANARRKIQNSLL